MSEKNKKIIFNLIIIILAVSVIILFVYSHIQEKNRIEQIASESEEYEVDDDANKRADAVIKSLGENLNSPSFVIWGDEGPCNENVDVSALFSKTMSDSLYGDLSTAYQRLSFKALGEEFDIQMNNMGVRDECINEIIARSGGRQIVTEDSVEIPAAQGKNINVDFKDDDGNYLRFAEQSEDKFGETTIADIKGTIVAGEGEYDSSHKKFAFSRAHSGEEVIADAGTPVITESSEKYKSCVPILYFDSMTPNVKTEAERELTGTVIDSAIYDFRMILDAHTETAENDRYIIIVALEDGSDADLAMEEEFGNHYIRANTTSVNMTDDDYSALSTAVYESLEKQGCFDETKKQVKNAIKELEEL